MTNKEVSFSSMRIILDANEFQKDQFCDDPEGDNFSQIYLPEHFTDAMRKYLELADKKWECIDLAVITTETDGIQASFAIRPKLSIWAKVNVDKLHDENAQKMTLINMVIDGKLTKRDLNKNALDFGQG